MSITDKIAKLVALAGELSTLAQEPIDVEGGMTLAECMTALRLFLKYVCIKIEVTGHADCRPKIEVDIYDGDKWSTDFPSLAAAYQSVANAHDIVKSEADAVADLSASLAPPPADVKPTF